MVEGRCSESTDLVRLPQPLGPAAVQAQATQPSRLQEGYQRRLGTWAEVSQSLRSTHVGGTLWQFWITGDASRRLQRV